MEKKVILLSEIKNNLFAVAIPKEFIEAAILLAMQYGAKGMMIVHADTYELIAGSDEHQAAQARGDEKVEVLLWNIPKDLVFGAKLFKNAKGLSYQEGSKLAKEAMTYFSFKKNGAGTALRKMLDPDDQGLADFVAGLFGTNRTTLYSWLKVAEAKPELLKFVDKGTVTMEAAERVVNQRNPKVAPGIDTEGNNEIDQKSEKKRRFVNYDEISRISELTPSELSFITETLPDFLPGLRNTATIPNDVLVERIYQHVPKKGSKKGDEPSTPKVDHIEIALQVSNFKVLITIHEIDDNATPAGAAIKLPVTSTDIGKANEDFAIAA